MLTAARRPIPFSEPSISDAEHAAVRRAMELGALTGNGAFCREAEATLRELCGVRHALLTTSCTHALEMALMTLNLGDGDEVIVPSFTFPSTATAIVRQGARPVFVDIDPQTFNIDVEAVAAAVTKRTRGIIPVHYAGQGCAMDALARVARHHGLWVVEDAAQGIGATWRGQALGTLGDIGCLSFHATKNIGCGEGGAFLTNDDTLARRAEIIREKGTNRAAFLRGEVDKYTWVGEGSSFVLSDLLAAFLNAQLLRTYHISQQRMSIWNRYFQGTAELERRGLLRRPCFQSAAGNNGHLFGVLIRKNQRDRVLYEMKARGVNGTFHYVPLHSSPFVRERFGGEIASLPVTDYVSDSLLRLPLYAHMTDEDVEYVVRTLYDVLAIPCEYAA